MSEEDIAVVSREFSLSNEDADQALRENKGDLEATLRALVNA